MENRLVLDSENNKTVSGIRDSLSENREDNSFNSDLHVTAIRLVNFKAFVDSGWIELNKITLLLGKNSIGKSSITQALQMLKVCYTNWNEGRIQPGLLSLEDNYGSFSDIKNNENKDTSFVIGFRLEGDSKQFQYLVEVDGSKSETKIDIKLLNSDNVIFSISSFSEIDNIFFARLENPDYKSEKERLFISAVNALKDFASQIEYIEPLRNTPNRKFSVSGTLATSVGRRGDNTYDMLFYLSQIKNDVPEPINHWLTMFGYELLWKSSGENKNEGGFWLRNLKTGSTTNIVDNGFGILQSLPIVVAMAMKKSGLLIVDTPEAHLQSPIESQFADIIQSTFGGGYKLLLETGSEQILLRLRKLIAEGKIKPDDVSCYFVDESEGDNVVKCIQIPLLEDGSIHNNNSSFYDFFSSTAMDLMEIKKMQFERIRKMKNEKNCD